MNSSLILDRDFGEIGMAQKVLIALQPDNKGVPADTTIHMKAMGGSIHIELRSSGDLASFLRTIDDLLLYLQAAEGVAKERL